MIFKNNKDYEVVCFTANQIPGISERIYPKELSGNLYPKGIPIEKEAELPELIKKFKVNEVILAYSDLSHEEVMNKASLVLSHNADFKLLSAESTMLKSKKKIISVCAVRTGAGKSPTTRKIAKILRNYGKKFVVVRHPMPYGNLRIQEVQRFANFEDLNKHKCTIEEREEYEPHIEKGTIVYAGVDYEKILRTAEKEAEIILWDGGNNDTPFFKPDLNIVIADALRPGHELRYYPGETNLRMADVVIINKENAAQLHNIQLIKRNIRKVNKTAKIIDADSILSADENLKLGGKRILVIEDGPTLTHGGMSFGAGFKYAKDKGVEILESRRYAIGSIKKVFEKYPHLNYGLPAMGYSKKQIKELEETIKKSKADVIISATPIDLRRVLSVNIPILRVSYSLKEKNISLEKILKERKFI